MAGKKRNYWMWIAIALMGYIGYTVLSVMGIKPPWEKQDEGT